MGVYTQNFLYTLNDITHNELKINEFWVHSFCTGHPSDDTDMKDSDDAATPDAEPVVLSAHELGTLGDQLRELTDTATERLNELQKWMTENSPQKVSSARAADGETPKYRLVTGADRLEQMKIIMVPFEDLKQLLIQVKTEAKKDTGYLNDVLEADVLMLARCEIAVYFAERDPLEIFKGNLVVEKEDSSSEQEVQTTNLDTVKFFMGKCFEEHPIPDSCISRIYSSIVGSATREMSADEFGNLFAKMHWRCVKDTIMTDEFDIAEKPFKKMCRLQVGEIVRLKAVCQNSKSGMKRFQAETLVPDVCGDAASPAAEVHQGWVTLESKSGAQFFHLHTPGYEVVKQTVMTDIFEMNNFRAVVRLKAGDQVRAIGFPRKEAKSGLVRVKCVTVGRKDGKEYTGFVTVEGNQSSVYLKSVETLAFAEEEEKQPEGAAEQAAPEESPAEVQQEAGPEESPESPMEVEEQDGDTPMEVETEQDSEN